MDLRQISAANRGKPLKPKLSQLARPERAPLALTEPATK
jgi:hypothetical protein